MATKRKVRVRPWRGWAWVYFGKPCGVYRGGEIAWGALAYTRKALPDFGCDVVRMQGWKPIRVEIRPVQPKRRK